MLSSLLSAAVVLWITGLGRIPPVARHAVSHPAVRELSVDSLRVSIVRRVAAVKDAVAGVAFRDMQTGDSLFVNADDTFHAASTMKVPVMIELYRRVDAGALSLDQGILLVNQFASIVDHSAFNLDAGDDSDSASYAAIGKRVPVRELIDQMIT